MGFKVENRTKSQQIADHLRDQLRNGTYQADERFYSNNNLASEFGVSTVTAGMIISLLAQEGFLYRINGKGTFVAARDDAPMPKRNTVAVCVRTEGHLYEPMSRRLITGLQEQGALALTANIEDDSLAGEQLLREIIAQKPYACIVDAAGGFPIHVLKELESEIGRLVFLMSCDSGYPFKALSVLTDVKKGLRLATQHLLDMGHRDIMYLTHGAENFKHRPDYPFSSHCGFVTEADRLANEHGFAVKGKAPIFYMGGSKGSFEDLCKVLKRKRRPTAFVASSDYRAKVAIDAGREAGLRVPEDMAVVGRLNTPWSTMLDVTLSTVSIREDAIIDTVLEKLAADDFEQNVPERIIIEPELIIRTSSGGTPPAQEASL